MSRSTILWILAVIITLLAAWYQRMTGPTYPVDGTVLLAGSNIEYKLTRTHGGEGDQEVPLIAPDSAVSGAVVYRRYKTGDNWSRSTLERRGDTLAGFLPHQPPAGKLEYYVELVSGNSAVRLPESNTVVTRFKGAVPLSVLLPHVLFIFFAMLFSTRAGLEAISVKGKPRTFVFWTVGLLTLGGMILGPVVQKYAFGAYWTGFPFGTDLTDNKTLLAFVAWLVAIAAVLKKEPSPRSRWFVLAASIILMAVYLIPHSMMGSELDYSKLDKTNTTLEKRGVQD